MHNRYMANNLRVRRTVFGVLVFVVIFVVVTINTPPPTQAPPPLSHPAPISESGVFATDALSKLAIKGRAPKTDYTRQQFGSGWETINGCDTRNIILHRDMPGSVVDASCNVTSGTLHDPYTGKTIHFVRGSRTSSDVQIDHVVALSDAWQKGAQQLTLDMRKALANDPLELLAVDGPANQQKSDGDAATWLPPNKAFRCEYVARQIAIKRKYNLWITQAEHDAMQAILARCPEQTLPIIDL